MHKNVNLNQFSIIHDQKKIIGKDDPSSGGGGGGGGGDQSPSINRDRDRGTRESGGYRLGHCALGYRGWSILST